MNTGLYIFFILFSIIANIIFVISEFILIRIIKPSDLFGEINGKKTKFLKFINRDINTHILSSQIGITSTHILFGALAFNAFTELNSSIIEKLSISGPSLTYISMALSFLLVVIIFSLTAEYIPKIFASKNLEMLTPMMAPIIIFSTIFFLPVTYVIKFISNIIFRIINLNVPKHLYNPIYSEDELKSILQRSQKEGYIAASEHQLINSIFEFTDTRVKSILTPRPDVIAIEINDDMKEFLIKAKKSNFSKFPIYEGTLENIVGILHLKELAYRKYELDDFDFLKVKRGFLKIHENMKLDLLLKKMKKNLTHIAIVYDEYGIFAGIVTLEDVLDALVGNLKEATRNFIEIKEVEKVSNTVYKVNPNISLKKFNKLFNTHIHSENSPAIAGLILERYDGLPEEHDEFTQEGIIFYNFHITGKRIAEFNVKIKKKHQTKKLKELFN